MSTRFRAEQGDFDLGSRRGADCEGVFRLPNPVVTSAEVSQIVGKVAGRLHTDTPEDVYC